MFDSIECNSGTSALKGGGAQILRTLGTCVYPLCHHTAFLHIGPGHPIVSYVVQWDPKPSFCLVSSEVFNLELATFYYSSSRHVSKALESFLRIKEQKRPSPWGLVVLGSFFEDL